MRVSSYYDGGLSNLPLGLQTYGKFLNEFEDARDAVIVMRGRADKDTARYESKSVFKFEERDGNICDLPCSVKYYVDRKTGRPYKAFIITPLGKAIIDLGLKEEGRIIPRKISLSAHDDISAEINYKHPLSVRANIKSVGTGVVYPIQTREEALRENIDYDPESGFAQSESEPYDPERAFLEGGGYDPEEGLMGDPSNNEGSVQDQGNKDPINLDMSPKEFTELQRFYIVSKREKETFLVEHNEGTPEKPKIVYGPESYQAHTNECLYLTEAQKGVWIGVTPQNSEAEPRANEELWLLKFHHYIFINVSIDALPIIKKMNTEGESYGWN